MMMPGRKLSSALPVNRARAAERATPSSPTTAGITALRLTSRTMMKTTATATGAMTLGVRSLVKV